MNPSGQESQFNSQAVSEGLLPTAWDTSAGASSVPKSLPREYFILAAPLSRGQQLLLNIFRRDHLGLLAAVAAVYAMSFMVWMYLVR